MKPTQIIVEVFGGVVQGVYCSDQRAQVTLVDWDSESAGEPGLVEITVDGNRQRYALVDVSAPRPLSDLAETDLETALQAAQARANS